MFPDLQWTFERRSSTATAPRTRSPRATHVGEFMGVPGTGRKFQIEGALFYKFDDGLIAEERRIYDLPGCCCSWAC